MPAFAWEFGLFDETETLFAFLYCYIWCAAHCKAIKICNVYFGS